MAQNLNDLLSSSSEASDYFESLPQDVQNCACNSGGNICSLEDLMRFIKGLTGGHC